jgi:hypothetical protein
MRQFDKDPDATVDYGFDWSGWLKTDEITSSNWSLTPDEPDGLSIEDNAYTSSTTTVWLSKGIVAHVYTVTNQIATLAGRTDRRSFLIAVVER